MNLTLTPEDAAIMKRLRVPVSTEAEARDYYRTRAFIKHPHRPLRGVGAIASAVPVSLATLGLPLADFSAILAEREEERRNRGNA